jgi:16S rRNA (guanine527-N7)-methyltransferase
MRKDIIEKWAENKLKITDTQFDALEAYQNRVLEINKHMNLTAITGDEDFAVKHIIDSLTLLPYIREGAGVIDIGTGAGFPGLVLRIMKNIRLTLLDSLRKRVVFLRETADMLGFPETECVHARAEEWQKKHAEVYDICTARAVASLDKLAGYALPLVKKDGLFLAMKGRDVGGEIENAKPALKKFGGVIEEVKIAEIAEGLEHSVVVIRKGR